MDNYIAITGPAGAGKTTTILRELEDLIGMGRNPANIRVGGLTHATRKAVTESLTVMDPENVRTLSSLCLRLVKDELAAPKVVTPSAATRAGDAPWSGSNKVSMEAIDLWNSEWLQRGKMYRFAPITGGTKEWQQQYGLRYSAQDYRDGDRDFAQYMAMRVSMTPMENWPPRLQELGKLWKQFKLVNGLNDFTDFEELVLEMDLPPEYGVEVMVWDEAQDYSALDMAVVHHLGAQLDWYYCAGDPNQILYYWRGGSGFKQLCQWSPVV